MGDVLFRRPDGALANFTIQGDTPTPDEQARINAILSGQQTSSSPSTTDSPSTLDYAKAGLGSIWNQTQAGVDYLGAARAQKNDGTFAGYSQEDWEKAAEAQMKEAAGYSDIVDDGINYGSITSTIAGSAPYSIPTIAGSYFGPMGARFGLAVSTLLEAPSNIASNVQAQKANNDGKVNYDKAIAAAFAQSTVEAIGDRFTFGVAGLFAKAGKKVAPSLIKDATEGALKKFFIQTGKTVTAGTASEATQEAAQQAIQRLQAGQDLGSSEAVKEYLENAILGGISGGLVGGVAGGIGHYGDLKNESAMRQAVEDAQIEASQTARAYDTNVPANQARREAQVAPEGPADISGMLPDYTGTIRLGDEAQPAQQKKSRDATRAREKEEPPAFSEEEYIQAVDAMRKRGKSFSPDAIKSELKIGRAKASAIFSEMAARKDGFATGDRGQYLRPAKTKTAEAEDIRQDYSVAPVPKANQKAYGLTINGRQIGQKFSSPAEAESFAKDSGAAKFEVSRVERPDEYALYRTQYRKVDGREEIVGRTPVKTFSSLSEANEAAKTYDPNYSPETNDASYQRIKQERLQKGVDAVVKRELAGPQAALQGFVDKMAGPGKVDVQVVPTIEGRPGTISEGVTIDAQRDERGRIQNGLKQILKVSSDLFNGDQNALNEVATHEVVHVLRNADLLKAPEWNALEQKALNEKVPGKKYTWMQAAVARTGGNTPFLGEEAIAEMLRYHVKNPTALDKPTRSKLGKLIDFIKKVAGLGKRYDGDAVIRSILGGEIAARPEGAGGLGARPYPGKEQFSSVKVPPYYMHSDRFFSGLKQEKGPAQQWLGILKNSGIKKEELEWLGLEQWLKDQDGPISRGDILDFIRANALDLRIVEDIGNKLTPEEDQQLDAIKSQLLDDYRDDVNSSYQSFTQWVDDQIKERTLNADRAETYRDLQKKIQAPVYHEDTTQEGGSDYMEFRFVLPGLQPAFNREAHYGGLENILVAARTKTRHYGDGKKVLFIEEIQSDLHQAGRKSGYADASTTAQINALNDRLDRITMERVELNEKKQDLIDRKTLADLADNRALAYELHVQLMELHTRVLDNQIARGRAERELYELQDAATVPDAPLKSSWAEFAFKRLARHAAENGYDAIAWHGDPDSIALTEGYHALTSREETGDDGKTQTHWYIGEGPSIDEGWAPRVTGVVNLYRKKLPQFAGRFFKKMGGEVQLIQPQASARQKLDVMEAFPFKGDFYSFMANFLADMPVELRQQMDRAAQIINNQRPNVYNPETAFERAGVDLDMLGAFIERIDPGSAAQMASNTDENGNPLVARFQMDIAEDMERTALEQGFPMFSAVTRADREKVTANPNFQNWFGNSIVADEDGLPKVVYHGTKADIDFSRFRKLSHFGSLKAATDRLGYSTYFDLMSKRLRDKRVLSAEIAMKNGIRPKDFDAWWEKLPSDTRLQVLHDEDPGAIEKMRIYPVYLSLQKPIRIHDDGGLDGWLELTVAAEMAGAITGNEAAIARKNGGKFFIDMLKGKGFDGFVYRNSVEDPGSYSYITFDPGQIKSINNKGTWNRDDPRINYSSVKIDTPQFKAWFKNSKIVDADGKPLKVYHGTPSNFDAFDDRNYGKTDSGWYGRGIYFTPNPDVAGYYTTTWKSVDIPYSWEDIDRNFPPDADLTKATGPYGRTRMPDYTGANIMPVFLSIQNPYIWKGSDQTFIDAEKAEEFTKRLQAEGYDGVVVPAFGEKPGTWAEIVAFQPTQVKSVLNKGTWSENDKRTNYSSITKPLYSTTAPVGQRVPPTPPADKLAEVEAKATYNNVAPVLQKFSKFMPAKWGFKYEKAVEDTFIGMQDRMLPWGKMIDRMKANGGFITNENDVYFREQLFSGQTDAALQAADTNFYQPFLKAVNSLPVTKADMEEARKINDAAESIIFQYKKSPKEALTELYLYARHAQERNAVMRQRNDPVQGERNEQFDMGSGMSDREAQDILAWFDSKPFGKKFSDENDAGSIRSLFRAIVSHTNDVRVAGELNPEFRGTKADQYRDYAPLRDWIDEHVDQDDDAVTFLRAGKGYNIRGYEDRAALGRGSIAANIVANAVMQNEEAIIRAGKNAVGRSVLKLLRDNPDLTNGFAEIIESRPMRWGLDRRKGVVRRVPDNSLRTDPRVLTVKEVDPNKPGRVKETFVRFKDERLATALTTKSSLGNAGVGPIAKYALKVNHFLGSMATSWNPEFMISNMIRDLQTATLNLSEYEMKGLRRDILKQAVPSLRQVYKAMRDGDKNNPALKDFEEFRAMGGMTAFMGLRDLNDTIQRINKVMAEDASGAPGKVRKQLRGFKKWIEDLNLAVENGTRLAAYRNLRDRYLAMTNDPADPKNIRRAKERAAFAAKNLTVNFNMGGTNKPVLNAFYLFYNASLQGAMAMLNPMMRSKKMRRMWMGVIAAGLMQDLLNYVLSPEDDDGISQYDKIPDYILEHNWVMMDPFGVSERGYFKLPMPYLMNAFFNSGRMTSKMLRGGESVGDGIYSIFATGIESLNPFGSGGNAFLNAVAPTLIDPLIDVYTNTDFAGRSIAPEEAGFGQPSKRDSQLYWNNTHPGYITVAKWAGNLTGGEGDYLPGTFEWSPNTVEYWLHFLGGGALATVERASKLGLDVLSKGPIDYFTSPEFSVNDVPFARRAYGNVSEREDSERYFENRDKVLRVLSELRAAQKDGDSQRYLSVMQRYPDEYRMAIQVRGVESQRRKLSRTINAIRDKDWPDSRKEAAIKALKEQKNGLIKRGNAIMKEMR